MANADDEVIAIRRALADGLNTHALDLVRRAAASASAASELDYLGALASARMGAIGEAEAWLARMDIDSLADRALAVEAHALAGRIAKERFARSRASPSARRHASTAIDRYRCAFELSGSPYAAVNAATMAMLAGDAELAAALARHACDACERETQDDHWIHAARGEALLLLGRADEAAVEYERARVAARSAHGDVASMRRQLKLIGTPAARSLLEAMPGPVVVAFTGHMIDAPDRATERFPAHLEPAVAGALREWVARHPYAIGYSQPACGADLLFLEAMEAAGMQTHVVVPCATPDFIASSLSFAGEGWVHRFERALSRATTVQLATDEPLLGDSVLFEHSGNLLRGLARLQARTLETEPMLLAVVDPAGDARLGGTSATIAHWRETGGRVETIDLAALRGTPPSTPDPAPPPAASGRSLKSLLFADLHGFSRLPEQYTPRFVETFLGECRRLLDMLEHPVVDANTRGDGLYLVFEEPGDAAQFAMRLQHALARLDWTTLGLPAHTSARTGLHTGPVFETFDPVMNKRTFYGTHVNRTARLEPVVQPGHVFVTEAFAATLAASGDDAYRCHYIGEMPLAKQFGEARLYRLVEAGGD
jgi:class 3 adenylate cyclase